MNRKFKYYAAGWLILLAVFNVVCFALPGEVTGRGGSDGRFLTGYLLITLAFIGQLICAYAALRGNSREKLFYRLPLIFISFTGLILTIVFGVLGMVIPGFPNSLSAVICLLVLAFTAIASFMAKAASEGVENIDHKIKAQTAFLKNLTAEAESLSARVSAPEGKAACRRVTEALRYSDPVSHGDLADIESQITLKFREFSEAAAGSRENTGTLASELTALINDRNKKCQLLKGRE